MSLKAPPSQAFHFDIDKHLNPYVPRSQVHRLPKPISRFLGYSETPRKEVGNLLICFWSLVGTFLGLILVAGIFKTNAIQMYHPPTILASFGASAVLEYNVIKSPLGQPRNSILGHTFSAITGVIISKLFGLSSSHEELRWIAGALSCALATVVMTLTNTTHPPGGATALLAVVDPTVSAMGWMLVPLIIMGSVLMFVVALLVNNIQRQFPVYFWTDKECGRSWRRLRGEDEMAASDRLESQKIEVLQRERVESDSDSREYYGPNAWCSNERTFKGDDDVTRPVKALVY